MWKLSEGFSGPFTQFALYQDFMKKGETYSVKNTQSKVIGAFCPQWHAPCMGFVSCLPTHEWCGLGHFSESVGADSREDIAQLINDVAVAYFSWNYDQSKWRAFFVLSDMRRLVKWSPDTSVVVKAFKLFFHWCKGEKQEYFQCRYM